MRSRCWTICAPRWVISSWRPRICDRRRFSSACARRSSAAIWRFSDARCRSRVARMVAFTSSPLAATWDSVTVSSGCPSDTRWPCVTWMALTVPGWGAKTRAVPEAGAKKPATVSLRAYWAKNRKTTTAAVQAVTNQTMSRAGNGCSGTTRPHCRFCCWNSMTSWRRSGRRGGTPIASPLHRRPGSAHRRCGSAHLHQVAPMAARDPS